MAVSLSTNQGDMRIYDDIFMFSAGTENKTCSHVTIKKKDNLGFDKKLY